MPIELKTIETCFFDAVRPHPAFAGWKKKAHALVGPIGDTQFGIELMRAKGSFVNAQRVAVAVFASVSCTARQRQDLTPRLLPGGKLPYDVDHHRRAASHLLPLANVSSREAQHFGVSKYFRLPPPISP